MTITFQGGDIIALVTGGVLTQVESFTPDLDEVLEESPAAILATYIRDTLGLASDPESSGEWPLYVNFIPYEVDEVLAIYDTTGIYDGRLMSTNEEVNHYGIQIRIRSKDYTEGYLKLKQLVAALNQTIRQTVTRNEEVFFIQNLTQVSSIVRIGVEEEPRRRIESTVNFLTVVYKANS
jgi:hypothetical protein